MAAFVRSYVLSVLLHMLATITYGYSIYWCSTNPDIPTKNPKGVIGGRLKYLTYWDLWIQFTTFFLCLLCDLLRIHSNGSLVKLRDTVFNCLALPIGFFVVISFWSIYAIDRELIFPVGIEKWYPIWLNHSTHSIVFPILVLESYLVSHNWSRHQWSPNLLLFVTITYLLWVLYIASETEHWVYGILEVLSWPVRGLFFAGSAFTMLSLFYFGQQMQTWFWSTDPKQRVENRKKK